MQLIFNKNKNDTVNFFSKNVISFFCITANNLLVITIV